MPSTSEEFQQAVQLHQAGRLSNAEQIYRGILAREPNHADAIHLLGVIAYQAQRHNDAIELIQKAIALRPQLTEAYNNLGAAYRGKGDHQQAIAAYRKAISLNPNYADACRNLGVVLNEAGEREQAIGAYRQATLCNPSAEQVHFELANLLRDSGRANDAINSYRRAIELRPNFPVAYIKLAELLRDQGKLDEALATCQTAIQLDPKLADAHRNLGIVLTMKGDTEGAFAAYRRALEINPEFVEALCNLANAFRLLGQLDEALEYYRRAITLRPTFYEAYSNYLYTIIYSPDYDEEKIYRENAKWNQVFAQPLKDSIKPHTNDRSTTRRLRIGYVSPDFFFHPIGRFMLPLLGAHDHTAFEIFAYASVPKPDMVTQECQARVDVWRDVRTYSDEQVAELIRNDQIDILVDLSMHMAHNRLLIFARKPAPVQVTYLAYPGSTGLETIDYRLTDNYMDPPNETTRWYSEESFRLPGTAGVFHPIIGDVHVNPLPALKNGWVTFGCLNAFCKVTNEVLMTWVELLKSVPQSRLMLHVEREHHRAHVTDVMTKQGIAAERLIFTKRVPITQYLKHYHEIDIALDPFPYGGGTTTCDALWMGVPVVTRIGKTAVGRSGLSILSIIDLGNLAANSTAEYLQIAQQLASNLPQLATLRATMRDRMQRSTLMNAPHFARNMEAAFREMWRRYCEC